MEKLPRHFPSVHPSPRRREYDELDGFLFVPDDDLNLPSDSTPTKSPARSPLRNALIPTVMNALTTVASSENLLVTNIAKTVLTGAAARLTTASIGGVPGVAVGALIAGGIYAYRTFRNKSAMEVLRSLSPSQQKQLIVRLRSGLKVLGVQDLAMEIMSRSDVKDIALEILSEFLEEKYGLRVMRA